MKNLLTIIALLVIMTSHAESSNPRHPRSYSSHTRSSTKFNFGFKPFKARRFKG